MDLKAPYAYGSLVEVKFSTVEVGQKTAYTVKQALLDGHGGRKIWMGPISTREERMPGKQWGKLKEEVGTKLQGRNVVFCERTRA
eukprot:1574343-Pyramimonas_sp.AAC.1